MTQHDPLFLDDLAVGAEYRSAEQQLDVEQIFDFARQFDPQPFHLDEEAAKDSLFQGLAASGWHTAAITMKLLVSSFPLGNGVIGAGGEIEWPRPTRPGDTLHVVSKILDIVPSRSKPDRGMVTLECRTVNQHGDTCQRLVAKLVVMRKQEQ
ncbi:MaoC family dehydratase [Pollutimonas bauzanensis]|uniref:Acyl dehydratase n=1 Tax=Pollutimonas bauzanensis TaxID=658167 RepID=A0A1M5Q1H0_9BURK|nr:MaoC family dehydratase [Pollutimonas bauzanensis]SHH07601.1 Acyl dehydratase [Pollutimonas bauzanensis]